MLQQGFRDRNGQQLMGSARCSSSSASAGAGARAAATSAGVYDDIAEQLDEVVEQEREGIDRRLEEASRSGDQRRQEIARETSPRSVAASSSCCPPDLAGRCSRLQQYDFMDDAARERFEELMDQLREQLMQSYFNQISEGMQNLTPERMAAHEGHAHRAQPDARAA